MTMSNIDSRIQSRFQSIGEWLYLNVGMSRETMVILCSFIDTIAGSPNRSLPMNILSLAFTMLIALLLSKREPAKNIRALMHSHFYTFMKITSYIFFPLLSLTLPAEFQYPALAVVSLFFGIIAFSGFYFVIIDDDLIKRRDEKIASRHAARSST